MCCLWGFTLDEECTLCAVWPFYQTCSTRLFSGCSDTDTDGHTLSVAQLLHGRSKQCLYLWWPDFYREILFCPGAIRLLIKCLTGPSRASAMVTSPPKENHVTHGNEFSLYPHFWSRYKDNKSKLETFKTWALLSISCILSVCLQNKTFLAGHIYWGASGLGLW